MPALKHLLLGFDLYSLTFESYLTRTTANYTPIPSQYTNCPFFSDLTNSGVHTENLGPTLSALSEIRLDTQV